MILSFVYLLSISEMKIKTRDKFNSPLFTHSIILENKKIKISPRMILIKTLPISGEYHLLFFKM